MEVRHQQLQQQLRMSERMYDNKYHLNGAETGSLHAHSNSQGRGGSNLLIAKGTGNIGSDHARVKLQMGGRKKPNSNQQQQLPSRNEPKHSLLGGASALFPDSYMQQQQNEVQAYPGNNLVNQNFSSRTIKGSIVHTTGTQGVTAHKIQFNATNEKKPRRLRKNFDLLTQAIKNSSTVKKEKKINFSSDSRPYNNTGQYHQSSSPQMMMTRNAQQQQQDSIAQIYQYGVPSFKDRKSSVYDPVLNAPPLHAQSHSQRVGSHHSTNSTHQNQTTNQHNSSLFSQISIKDNSQTPQKSTSYSNSRNPSMMMYQNAVNHNTQPIVVGGIGEQKQYVKVNDKLMRRYLMNENLAPNVNSQSILNINTASDINIYNNSFIVNTSSKKQSQSQNQSRSNSLKRNQQLPMSLVNQKLLKQSTQRQAVPPSHQPDSRVNLANILSTQQQQLQQPHHLLPSEYSQKFVNLKPNSSQAKVHNNISQRQHTSSNPRAHNGSSSHHNNQKFNQIAEAYSTQNFFSAAGNSNNGGGLNQQQSAMQNHNQQMIGMLMGQRNNNQNKSQSSVRSLSRHTKQQQKQQQQQPPSHTQSFDMQPFNQSQEYEFLSSGGSFSNPNNSSLNKFKFHGSQSMSKRQQLQKSVRQPQEDSNRKKDEQLDIISESSKKKQMSLSLFSQGKIKLLEKDYQQAITLFSDTLKLDPTNADAKYYRALSKLDQGQLKEAIQDFNQVLAMSETHSQIVHILLSIAHKRNSNIQESLAILTQCIRKHPQYPDAYLARGQCSLLQEKYQEALKDFQQYSQLVPQNGMGYLGAGDSYKALQNWPESINAYSKALALLQKSKDDDQTKEHLTSTLLKRGLSYYQSKQIGNAMSDLQQVISRDQSQYKAHFYIGKILSRQYSETPRIVGKGGDNQKVQNEAILHFEQVVKHQLNEVYSGNALFEIAKLRLFDKDFYEAYFNLKRAIDSNFNSKRLQLYKDFTEGVLYLIKRKIKKGVQILSDLLELLVNSKEKKDKKQFLYLKHQGYLYRAYGYVAIEKYELALQDIKRAKKLGKLDLPTIYNKLLSKGILQMDHEDYLMATKYFHKGSQKFPLNKDTYCLYIISIVRSYTYSMTEQTIDNDAKLDQVLQAKVYMDSAIKNCNKVRVPSLFFFRGLLKFQLHMFYEALQDFNVAIEEEEEPTASYYLARGRCYACLSILNEAMKDLSIALNLDETMQDAYIYRGKCAYLLGDNNLAFLDFQRLILTDPKNPMVHVYAGNLLMTTGAYQDAIKAFSNADTVQQTAVAAFQRARCYCALTDLENAKMQFKVALELGKQETLVKLDSQCISALLKIINNSSTNTGMGVSEGLDILNNLIDYYKGDSIKKLQKRDAKLNIQIIPNVKRIKIEKAAVAKQLISQQNEQSDMSISVDMTQSVDVDSIADICPYSYYYENVFQLEDFYLFRAVMHFYKRDFKQSVEDFETCSAQKQRESISRGPRNMQGDASPSNGAEHQDHLMMYSQNSSPISNMSARTDLSDVGLCSQNIYENNFNILLCYLQLKDLSRGLQKLNEIISFAPKKYSKSFYLIRAVIFEELGEKEKSMKDLKKLEQTEPKLYKAYFEDKKDVIFEPFPIKTRLCSKFENVKILISKNRPAIITKPSFSMPFIKPPNMIPNIDEEAIQGEFTLKQIDAPMPEAPWIRRCQYGIKFTDNILQDEDELEEENNGDDVGQSVIHQQKKNQEEEKKISDAPMKGAARRAKDYNDQSPYIQSMEMVSKQPNHKGISERILQNATVYLVEHEEHDHFDDKHKISLFDDSKFEDLTIDHNARHSLSIKREVNLDLLNANGDSYNDDDLLQQHLLKESRGFSDDSSDDEDEEAAEEEGLNRSDGVIYERDSMVLMGDSVPKGIKKRKL